jgi:mRNA-degrading endonuclease RelE of RelBE toxin-antitoxin system
MSDKKKKYLSKLPLDEYSKIQEILLRIQKNDLIGLDVKKLKGYKTLFRVRHGRHRIIFENDGMSVIILDITKRDDQTYRDF